MPSYKCAADGCYAQVDERGAECGGHEIPDYPQILIPEHVDTYETDRRGRFTLGKKYGDQKVTIAVVKTEDIGE